MTRSSRHGRLPDVARDISRHAEAERGGLVLVVVTAPQVGPRQLRWPFSAPATSADAMVMAIVMRT